MKIRCRTFLLNALVIATTHLRPARCLYLQQQHLLSSLFNHIRALDEDKIDFYMAPRTKDFQEDKNFLFNCIISWSVLGFYLPLAFVTTYDIFSYFYL